MHLAKMSEGSNTDVTDIGGFEWDHIHKVMVAGASVGRVVLVQGVQVQMDAM